MHCHSFFSYNAHGWSPSRIAWESRRANLYAAALTDFDVLDGLDEFLQAGEMLSLRTAVHLETRAFLNEYSDVDINSPGEPGVTYIMGMGFTSVPASGSRQAETLAAYRQGARDRNLALIERINAALPEVALDYARDVLPLTPMQVATERHIMSAYVNKSCQNITKLEARVAFWARVLKTTPEATATLLSDGPALEDKVRSALAKRGGIGYVQPSRDTFPSADEFIKWVLDCGAIPTVTWLDGTTEGEADPEAMLELLVDKGCAALNIVPDRNWNIKDPQARAIRIKNLHDMVREADALHLPINIGTEMNKKGLPFADDLDGEVLSNFRESFTRGAQVMVGHTLLARFADFGYLSEAACSALPDRKQRNAIFAAVGALPPLTSIQACALRAAGPAEALRQFKSAIRA